MNALVLSRRRHHRLLAALLCAAALTVAVSGAARADEIGADDFRISQLGGTGNTTYNAFFPAVAYNSADDEYLVVWVADDPVAGNDQWRVFGQRIDAATGAEIGVDDFPISAVTQVGGGAVPVSVAVAYNPTRNEYLVVWNGLLAFLDYEVFMRRLTATGDPIDAGDVRISNMNGPGGDDNYDAFSPAVAYNPTAQEYLVVWSGDDEVGGRLNEEFEIYGQRIDAITGAQVGVDDFPLSDVGGIGSGFFDAQQPAVVYNTVDDEYLVVWLADDVDSPGIADNELEIYGQRLAGADATQVGSNDFRISSMGPAGNTAWAALEPDVAYDPQRNQYLVVWTGSETVAGAFDVGWEIYAQRLDHLGAEVAPEWRITDVGGLSETAADAILPAVAYNAANGQYLVVFRADDNLGGQVDGELEIHGQQIDAATGAEVGPNDVRLSDVGPNGSFQYQADFPAVAASPAHDQWLVVFMADDNVGGLLNDELEIFGQRYAPAALPLLWSGFETGNLSEWSAVSP